MPGCMRWWREGGGGSVESNTAAWNAQTIMTAVNESTIHLGKENVEAVGQG